MFLGLAVDVCTMLHPHSGTNLIGQAAYHRLWEMSKLRFRFNEKFG